jgi:hypothetical protein
MTADFIAPASKFASYLEDGESPFQDCFREYRKI